MPSKGVEIYAFIAVPGCSVNFGVPKNSISKTQINAWSQDHLEVESSNIDGIFNFTGCFYFEVLQDGNQIAYEYNNINSLTGNLDGGSMTSIRNTKSHRVNGLIVTYGFYDAGSGKAGLTNKDQCYVTVTPDRSDWMSVVAPNESSQASKAFSRFVLPCPHDCGMNSMQSSDLAIQDASDFLAMGLCIMPVYGNLIKLLLEAGATSGLIANIIYGIAITQKDSLEDMLAIGARYFEFRPGRFPQQVRCATGLGDDYYFIHAVIPGISFNEFLDRALTFLEQHQQEIIVIQLRSDGIQESIEQPSDEEKANIIQAAVAQHHGIVVGDKDDMLNSTVKQLRLESKRLIVLYDVDQYSSYNDVDYGTLDGSSIIGALNRMSASGQKGKPFTLLQCQCTATDVGDALKYSILTSNASTSLLMSSKATADTKTHPWLMSNTIARFTEPELLVVMNDFFDGATAEAAINLSTTRFNS